jgi:hypothetical protein
MHKKMDKNKFFEVAIKVLAAEANQTELKQLASFLKDERYKQLFNQLEKEWNKNYRYSENKFDYQSGLQKLRSKIEQQKQTIDEQRFDLFLLNVRIVQVAAVVVFTLLIISLVAVFDTSESQISRFAETIQTNNQTDNTRLILPGNREIEIDTKESEINYLKSKVKVVVDDEKEIDRHADGNRTAYSTIIVPFGRRSKVVLADGSIVWLNSGSKLIYPANFTRKKREVFLEGEAMFDVSHHDDLPFVVVTRDIEVEVLGTVFNVCAYTDDACTSTVLEQGSVEINYAAANLFKQGKLRITPGTRVQYNPNNKEITQQQVDTKYYTSWKNGMLIYKNGHLPEIVKQLTRYYNREISISDESLSDRSFTGKLDLKDDVADVLATIAFVSSLKVNQTDNHFYIKQ